MNDTPDHAATDDPQGSWGAIFSGRLGVVTLVLNLGILLFAVDTFVVTSLMPTVEADLGGLRFYSWTFSLFAVGSIIGGASAGPLTDAIGRRAAYVGAGVLFFIGLVGAVVAPDMLSLVGARLVQGLGGGAIAAQAYGLVGALYPQHLRSRILAVVSTVWGVATVLGPGIGGGFAELGLWRSAFGTIAVLAAGFTLLAWQFVPRTEGHGRLSVLPYGRLGLLAFSVLSLSFTSQFDSITNRATLVVLSLITATLAFRFDSRADVRMYPRGVLALTTSLGPLYWVMLLIMIGLTFVSVYSTLVLQVLHGVKPIVAAYIFGSLSIAWTLSALVVSGWRGTRELAAIAIGLVIIVIGAVGLALFIVDGPVLVIAICLGLIGWGIGFTNNPLIQQAIMAAAPDEKHIAGSSVQSIRTFGISLGAATAGMIAAALGLTGEVEPETVSRAVIWVYGVNAGLAVVMLTAIPIIIGRRKQSPPAVA